MRTVGPRRWRRSLWDDVATSTLEYALLLALVVVTVWVSYQALGAGTGRSVSGADERMTTAMNAPSSPCDTGGGAPAPPAGD